MSTGQPLEVLKTQVAANRAQSLAQACGSIYARGGVLGFWQGLVPWAWIEAVTKGGVLLLAQSEIESAVGDRLGVSPSLASALGGVGGGVAQGEYCRRSSRRGLSTAPPPLSDEACSFLRL
jgi:hypothetical protein